MPEDKIGNRDNLDLEAKADALRTEIGDAAFEEVVENARQRVLDRRGASEKNIDIKPELSTISDSVFGAAETGASSATPVATPEDLSPEILEEMLGELSGKTANIDHRDAGTADAAVKKLMGQ